MSWYDEVFPGKPNANEETEITVEKLEDEVIRLHNNSYVDWFTRTSNERKMKLTPEAYNHSMKKCLEEISNSLYEMTKRYEEILNGNL